MLDAAHLLRDQLGEFAVPTQQLLVSLADRAASTWEQPDAGMWEARDKRRHYTSSKVMCWVALDRATSAYTGAFGSDDLDASVLLLPLVGFLSWFLSATAHANDLGLLAEEADP